MKRVLGIDPGSVCTGFGIIDTDGNYSKHIANGVIKIVQPGLPGKLKYIQQQLFEIIDEYHPTESSVEKVFMYKNPSSVLKLGQARGVAIAACALKEIDVFEYTANQVKLATVGRGHATKQQVQHMVKVLLCLNELPATDAADALAAALCHAHTSLGLSSILGTGSKEGRQ